MNWKSCLLACALLQLPAISYAGPAEKMSSAKALEEGLKLRSQGDHAAALVKFKAAHSFYASPVTTYELGRAYEAVGNLLEARAKYFEVTQMPKSDTETSLSATARSDAQTRYSALTPRIPTVVLEVEGGKAPYTITLDGADLKAAQLGFERLVNPGKHVVVVKGADGVEETVDFELVEAEKRKVVVKFKASAPAPGLEPTKPPTKVDEPSPAVPAKDPRPTDPPKSSRATFGLVTGAAGVVVGGVGLGLFFAGKSGYASAKDRCDATGSCPPDAVTDAESANSKKTVGGALAIGGVLLLGAGVVLFVTAPSDKPVAVSLGPGTVSLSGRF